MNRHHPYGGAYDGPPRRGGGGGFGPDRSHRFDRGAPRGRGFGRGRGGHGGGGGNYGGYNGGVGAYDQGPPQGDIGGYNGYEAGPAQEPFYQNGNYNANVAAPGQFGAGPDNSGRFDQEHGNFEDGSGPEYGQGGGFSGRPQKRFPRRERDDKVHDSLIEERIQRERPCRTLFIRNIKYETNSEDVRRMFEEHGDIRTFFDLIANRGMVFVTYFDLRSAERARERLQGSEISGRPIDVHYSLPRDDHGSGRDKDKNQQMQGTLLVTLRNSISGQPIDDNEVRRKFQQFGDVKSVMPAGDRPDQRFVEFFDTRSCDEAHDRLRHQGLQDGVMEIVFASENEEGPGASPRRGEEQTFDRGRHWDEPPARGRRGGRGGRGRGRGFGGGGGGGGGGDDWDRRGGDWGRDRDRGRQFEDEFGRRDRGPAFGGRFDGPNGAPYGGPPSPGPPGPPGYGAVPPTPAAYAGPPGPAPPVDDRLEQAKKVQQLLAALKQPGGAPGPQAPVAPQQAPPLHNMSQQPGATPSYYGSAPSMSMPPQPYGGNVPPASNTGHYPHPSMPSQQPSAPQLAQPPASALSNLPPNFMALLQGGQAHPQQQPPAQSMPQMPYGAPPPPQQQMMASPPSVPGVSNMPTNGQPGYQQLMAYLQSQKRG